MMHHHALAKGGVTPVRMRRRFVGSAAPAMDRAAIVPVVAAVAD
jgi:hypothetical protein